jgi:hypothetical protein
MSCLSSRAVIRRPMLFWARLIAIQCLMAWSIPQTGMDELELSRFRGPEARATSPPIAMTSLNLHCDGIQICNRRNSI